MGVTSFFKGKLAKFIPADGVEHASGIRQLSGALNPTATAVDAPAGSTYQSTSTGRSYLKRDAGSTTNWVLDPGFITFADVAAAQAGTATGSEAGICYVQSQEAFYKYCSNCTIPANGDLILTTGAGGNTRWELIQKVSRTQGDTGWVNTDNVLLTQVSPTVARIALSGTGVIAIRSIRHELLAGNYDITVSGAAGVKFIYFDDGTGVLKSRDTLWDFGTEVPVMVAYWTGTAIAGLQTEYHGIRDTVWHYYAHRYFGTQYTSGITFTGSVQADSNTDPNSDTVQYLWSTTGFIQDEDAIVNVGVGNWLQTLGSGLTSTTAAIIPFYYWNGSFITTAAAMADRTPFIHAGGNTTPQWENAGTLTAATTGQYVVYHYFASPQVGGQSVFARPHNAVFGTLALAQQARPASLIWSNYAEIKHVYSAVFRVNTGWAPVPSHGCKLVSLQDFRTVAGGPVAATNPTSHAGLSGLADPNAHPDTSITSTVTTGTLDVTTETNLALVSTRLATYGHIQPYANSASYRVNDVVAQDRGIYRCKTAVVSASTWAADKGSFEQISVAHFTDTGTAALASASVGDLCYVESSNTFYQYVDYGGSPAVTPGYVLATADGGNSRWVSIAGSYTYFPASATNINGMTGMSVAEPGVVTSSTGGQAGASSLAARQDHNHDLGVHNHESNAAGGPVKANRIIVTQANAFTAGQALYLSGTTYALAKADVAATAEAVGIVESSDGSTFTMITDGYIAGLAGLTAGSVYFVSDATAGLLTATEPTTIGSISKPMLIADSTTSGFVVNMRGAVVGTANAKSQVAIAASQTDTVLFSLANYEAGVITGWVETAAPLREHFTIPFCKKGDGSYAVGSDVTGDSTGVSFDAVGTNFVYSSGALTAPATFTYSLDASAVGATFPLLINGTLVQDQKLVVTVAGAGNIPSGATAAQYLLTGTTAILAVAGADGIMIPIKNIHTATCVVTVTTSTVDGVGTSFNLLPNEFIVLMSYSSNYLVVG